MQVVDKINRNALQPVPASKMRQMNRAQRSQGHGVSGEGGCFLAGENQYWNQTTLQNIAVQYSMDVLRFGYM